MLMSEVVGGLRERRVSLGLTLKDLAERVGVTEGYVSYIERGERQGVVIRERLNEVLTELEGEQ